MIGHVIGALFRQPAFKGRNWLIRKLLPHTRYTPTYYGPQMRVNTLDYTNTACIMGHYGRELADIIETMPKDGLFLDIGANQGLYSLIAAAALPQGRVCAFEPNSSVYGLLLDNIARNAARRVEAFNCGLGPETGLVRFMARPNHSGGGHVLDGGSTADGQWVMLMSGDALQDVIGADVSARHTVCKIDTEGFELNILQTLASAGLLDHVDCYFIEIDHDNLARQNGSAEAIYALMKEHGFDAKYGRETGAHYDEVFTRSATA